MSKSRLLAGVALASLCIPVATLVPSLPLGVSVAQAQSANVSFQLFFDQLEPHGVWVHHAKYNYVFCPTGVDAGWRPYTHGRWLYIKSRGWYFASDEPFAWATYHYGRWFADQKLGWCWVPGTKWAPAWVSWRRSDAVIGWAPLPPEGDGYAVSVEVSRLELPEPYWVFVPTKRFVEPDLSVNIVIGSQQPDYFVQTRYLGPVKVEGDVVINNVIDVTYIEQTINQQVVVYQPQTAADPAAQSVDVDAQAIAVFDQDVAEPAADAAPPEPVEATDAAATIETEGGTAGATVDLPEEAGVATQAVAPDPTEQPPRPAASQETPAPTGEQPPAEQPSPQKPATSEDATSPGNNNDGQAAPAEPSAAGSSGQDTGAGSETCAPDAVVDGKCTLPSDQAAPTPDATTPVPDATAPTPTVTAPPAGDDQATPTPEAAHPAEPAAAPASDEAQPTDEPAAKGETPPEATAPDPAPACPPESMVDGKCPVEPPQPAQQ